MHMSRMRMAPRLVTPIGGRSGGAGGVWASTAIAQRTAPMPETIKAWSCFSMDTSFPVPAGEASGLPPEGSGLLDTVERLAVGAGVARAGECRELVGGVGFEPLLRPVASRVVAAVVGTHGEVVSPPLRVPALDVGEVEEDLAVCTTEGTNLLVAEVWTAPPLPEPSRWPVM